tara:strand:- start:347 stop:547 length:201 start_codon:yes stop_codon:yes gene_type:complete
MSSPVITLEIEFDACLARHGIAIAAERREAMFQAFLDFRDLIADNRDGLSPSLEPAFIHPAPEPST